MSYTEVKKQINDAEAAIERAKSGFAPKKGDPRPGLTELQERRKQVSTDIARLLLVDDGDAARRDELKRELAEVDGEIAAVNEEVESLQNLIATHKQYLSESAKLERRRAAVKAGQRVVKRATDDVPQLADKLQRWLDEGEKLFNEIDEIANANSVDFSELAQIALENDDRPAASHELASQMGRALRLNFDSVLAHWMCRSERLLHNQFVDLTRPAGTPPALFEAFERHTDALTTRVAQLRAKIEVAQTQEENQPCE